MPKNPPAKIVGADLVDKGGGVKSSPGLPSETPRPPMCRIFFPVKLLKLHFNSLFNIEFLAFYATKSRLKKAAFFIGISLWQ